MINSEHIDRFTGFLKEVLERELAAGNTIRETWQGDWSVEDMTVISLEKPFMTPVDKNVGGIEFRNINDIHYWKAEYYDSANRLLLVCGFSSPDDADEDF